MKCSAGLKWVKEISRILRFVGNIIKSTVKISQSKSCTNSLTNKPALSSWTADGFSVSSSPDCPINTKKKGALNFSQTRNDDEVKSRPNTFTRHDFRDTSDPKKCKLSLSKLFNWKRLLQKKPGFFTKDFKLSALGDLIQ